MEALIEELTVVGLDEDHTRAYVRLLQAGPTKVGNLTAYFDCSRSTLYRLLDDLVEQGFATKSLDTPTVYEAVPPEKLFESGETRIRESLNRLKGVEERWLDALQRFKNSEQREELDHWKKLEGTGPIYETLQRMIEAAEGSIDVASNHEVSVSLDLPIVDQTWRCFWRRVCEDPLDCRLMLDSIEGRCEEVVEKVRSLENVKLRTFSPDQIVHFVLVDESDLLTWVRPTPVGHLGKREDVAIWTDAPGSVFTHELLFEHLWPSAQPIG